MTQNGGNVNFNEQKEMLLQRKQALLDYLQSCINIEDFHGVCDAGMDLREVNLELDLIDHWLIEDDHTLSSTFDNVNCEKCLQLK